MKNLFAGKECNEKKEGNVSAPRRDGNAQESSSESPSGVKKSKKKRVLILLLAAAVCGVLVTGAFHVYYDVIVYGRTQREREEAVRQYREDKFARYRAENESGITADVLFLGDSLTDGCDLERWYPGLVSLNRGIGGDTTYTLQERLRVSAFDAKADVVVLLIGGNNVDTMLENYEDIVVSLRQNMPESRLIICSLTAMGRDWARKNDAAVKNNLVLEQIAARNGCAFVDLFTPLYDAQTGEIRAEYTVDGAHLTDAGYTVVSGLLRPLIDSMLAER